LNVIPPTRYCPRGEQEGRKEGTDAAMAVNGTVSLTLLALQYTVCLSAVLLYRIYSVGDTDDTVSKTIYYSTVPNPLAAWVYDTTVLFSTAAETKLSLAAVGGHFFNLTLAT
jgi:hypothetical protein